MGRMGRSTSLIAFLALACLSATLVESTEYYVDSTSKLVWPTCGDSAKTACPSLLPLVQHTTLGDTIILMPGTYSGDANLPLDLTGKASSLRGSAQAQLQNNLPVIDCGSLNPCIAAVRSTDLELSGLSFTASLAHSPTSLHTTELLRFQFINQNDSIAPLATVTHYGGGVRSRFNSRASDRLLHVGGEASSSERQPQAASPSGPLSRASSTLVSTSTEPQFLLANCTFIDEVANPSTALGTWVSITSSAGQTLQVDVQMCSFENNSIGSLNVQGSLGSPIRFTLTQTQWTGSFQSATGAVFADCFGGDMVMYKCTFEDFQVSNQSPTDSFFNVEGICTGQIGQIQAHRLELGRLIRLMPFDSCALLPSFQLAHLNISSLVASSVVVLELPASLPSARWPDVSVTSSQFSDVLNSNCLDLSASSVDMVGVTFDQVAFGFDVRCSALSLEFSTVQMASPPPLYEESFDSNVFEDLWATFPVENISVSPSRSVVFGQMHYVPTQSSPLVAVSDVTFRPAFNTTNVQSYLGFARDQSSADLPAVQINLQNVDMELMPLGTGMQVVGGPFEVQVNVTKFWFGSDSVNPIFTSSPVVSCADDSVHQSDLEPFSPVSDPFFKSPHNQTVIAFEDSVTFENLLAVSTSCALSCAPSKYVSSEECTLNLRFDASSSSSVDLNTIVGASILSVIVLLGIAMCTYKGVKRFRHSQALLRAYETV